jgi:hypothetical protein
MKSSLIEKFLERIVKRRSKIYALTGLYLILALGAGGYLAGNLIGYYLMPSPKYALPLFLIWLLPFFYILVRYFLRGAFSAYSMDQAALLTEKKVSGLNNSLINTVQLRRNLKHPEKAKDLSIPFVNELTQRTELKIAGINSDSIISRDKEIRSRNILFGVLTLLLLAMLIIPDFISRGHSSWLNPSSPNFKISPTQSENIPTTPDQSYVIENINLTFNFPAYTELKSNNVENSDGKVQVLPGTEVIVKGKPDSSIAGAELLLNGKDEFIMSETEGGYFSGQFIAREEGFYQFRIKTSNGEKILLPQEYSVTLDRDTPPRIKIFLANPKPLYYMTDNVQFFYESFDDYGVHTIELVSTVNGEIKRKTIKTAKNTPNELKGQFKWSLGADGFNPGDKVQYYLEALDNDNVTGPNVGQSEIFSFEIFDEQKKRRDLLAIQDELLEKMIDLLAENLVIKMASFNESPQGRIKLKKVLASNADQLINIISIAKSIRDQASKVESFPKAYITLLDNIITNFRKIRSRQINAMDQISSQIIKTSTTGLNFPPFEKINSNMVSRLETNILFLIKIITRERFNQVKTMDEDIEKLTESLRDAFDKATNKKTPLNETQIQSTIDKIKETLQKIMDQLSRQNQSMPDEFLNPSSLENISIDNLSAALEKMKDLISKGKVEEAKKLMEELTEELNALSRQLDDAAGQREDMVDMELLRKLDESLLEVLKLEKEQKKVLKKTTAINKSLREKQSTEFSGKLKDLFQLLNEDVEQIQGILNSDNRFLQNHKAIQEFDELLDKEDKIGREIQTLSQRTINMTGDKNISNLFAELNEARGRLGQIKAQKGFLQLQIVNEFKSDIPQILEKYGNLKEMIKIQDLHEFNSIFKNTYPEIFKWQNRFRSNRPTRPDINEKLKEDLQNIGLLNSSISRKLGSMMRDMNKDFLTQMNEQNKESLESMAEEQNKMSQKAQEVSEQFAEMNKKNPMISPRLSNKMSATERYMQNAKNNLKEHKVAEGIDAENRALSKLEETRDLIQQMKDQSSEPDEQGKKRKKTRLGLGRAKDDQRGGSVRMKKDQVDLPTEDQYNAPGQFRKDILKAMKNQSPKKYERMVMEYYKELVK